MTPALRFVFVTTFYPPYAFGGDGIDVQRLARALVTRGHRVTVVHERDAYRALADREPAPAGFDDGVEVVGLESRLGSVSTLLSQQAGRPVMHVRRLRQVLDAGGIDIVAFHNVSLIGGPGLLTMGADAVRLYVAHEHWLVCASHVLWRHNREACTGRECLRCVLRFRRPPQLWRYTGSLTRHVRHIDTFIARSAFSRDKHREFGFPRPMEVLPCFLPDATGPIATPDGPPHRRPYFLFAGRLERIKGLHTVLATCASYPDADLLIAGSGTEEAALRAQAEGHSGIHFLGPVAPADLARYYKHAVALIVPSVGFETFGLVLIEAFRQGTPVIARRLGPFPEIIDQSGGGELFETPDDLVASMRRLQQDRAHRDALGRSGEAASWRLWSESAVVERFLDIARQAAAARAARLGRPVPGWAA